MFNIDMIYSQMTANLNYECLEHLFSYLNPKQWVRFSQENETCNKIATSSKDFQQFTLIAYYSFGDPSFGPNEKRLDFVDFMEILELVAPKLKFAKLHTTTDEFAKSLKVCVSFGKFRYSMIISKPEEKKLMETFLTQTKVVQTLQVNGWDDKSMLEWKQFLQANPLKEFHYSNTKREYWIPITIFQSELVFMLPSNLERIKLNLGNIHYKCDTPGVNELLKRMTRLSSFHVEKQKSFRFYSHEGISYLSNTLQELCLKNRQIYDLSNTTYGVLEDDFGEEDPKIIDVIAKLTNLKKLTLSRFILQKESCRKIAENCQLISCLKLLECEISKKSFKVLMSLPNLSELHVSPEALALFTIKVKELKTLGIHECSDDININNFINALTMTQNLSCLKFDDVRSLSQPVARAIKQIIHARGQKIVLYTKNHTVTMTKCIKKVGEIAPLVPTKNEFEIIVSTYSSENLPELNLFGLISEA